MTRHALITGASSGIGRAMALTLAKADFRVTATGRDPAALAQLEAQGIETLRVDLSAADAMAVFDGLAPDVLVLNAGTTAPPGPLTSLTPTQILETVAVNVTAPMLVSRRLLPAMRARGAGHLVFVSSVAGHMPAPGSAVYSATKAAVASFAQSLRAELAPEGFRVTEIVAGRVQTALYRQALSDEGRARLYDGPPVVQPDDIAQMLLAVLSMPSTTNVSRFDIVPTYPVKPLSP